MKITKLELVALLSATITTLDLTASELRQVLSLDGTWQVAEGRHASPPTTFDHTVPVPGLLDMANPPFEAPGSTVTAEDRAKPWLRPEDLRREAFWYRRMFKLSGPVPAVALLKIHKARYGAKVFINGQAVGEHAPNFTPGWFNVRSVLNGKGVENEVLIRVGASLAQVPLNLTDGWDNEKSRYIPGIYDSVELVLSGTPHVVNVQTVPDVNSQSVRVVAELANAGTTATVAEVMAVVREAKSRRQVGAALVHSPSLPPGKNGTVEMTIPLKKARLWTPEDPFLYELELNTEADVSRTKFGLRTFTTDPESGRALLNGKVHYLRGSNVCIYRFFEDAARGGLPWDRDWVRKLHRRFKEMHWNSLRYCIGFPPEFWYDIADEEGILIQDEFPIWYSRAKDGWPEAITPADLSKEYTEWMRERWNHPCVVIWDAQNETWNDRVVAAAIKQVRGLDLSHRPWDNGWGTQQEPGDIAECHPYRSGRAGFSLADFARENGIPNNGPGRGSGKPPYLINEYAWLWINRDGSLPTLTTNVYARLVGENATTEARWRYYARTLAAKTEFWRVRRQCAGVLHFCGLGYSRPDGQTSDNFTDVEKLVYEPHFYDYVRDSFAPVGVAIDYWAIQAEPGSTARVPVRVINDLESKWSGSVTLRLLSGDRVIATQKRSLKVPSQGLGLAEFDVTFPAEPSDCELAAEIRGRDGKPVRSLRDVRVEKTPENLALGRPVTASTQLRNAQGFFPAALAVDGKPDTRWSSAFADNQWLAVDLGKETTISKIVLSWERAFGQSYAIEVSTDGAAWREVWKTNAGKGGKEVITFAPVTARHVRLRADKRGTIHGFSLWELQVFGR